MGLPKVTSRTKKVEIDGHPVECRSLSRAEAMKVRDCGEDIALMEATVIAFGTDTPLDEVKSWLEDVPSGFVDKLVVVISELSGLYEGAQKSG